jgi:hypothetical protein
MRSQLYEDKEELEGNDRGFAGSYNKGEPAVDSSDY